MSADQVSEVTVDKRYKNQYRGKYGGKYIVARIEYKRVVLWADNPYVEWHKELVESLEAQVQGMHVGCLGGGMLYVSESVHMIFIWDQSTTWGREDREQTAQMLKRAFPEFSIVEKDPYDLKSERERPNR